MILYRPVGPKELALIEASDWRAFPPRLPGQPIFYPVLNFEYAEEIAARWNSTREDNGFEGYVTRFEVDDSHVAQYQSQVVGGARHAELWVPAEALDDFNAHILGKIEVVARYSKGERVED